MDPQSFYRRLIGPESTALRRAVAGVPVAAVLLVLTSGLIEATDVAGEAVIPVAVLIAVGVGVFVGGWVAVPVSYVGFVAAAWIVELTIFFALGASEWEERNREHWQGDEAAGWKLLGQLIEYAVFIAMLVPFVALGVLLAKAMRERHGRDEGHRPLDA